MKFLRHSIDVGPYECKEIPATATTRATIQTEDDLSGLVNASRAKRAIKIHDPLALVTKTYASFSSSRSLPAYYVTHPPSVIGYEDDYQGEAICDDQEDSLMTTMMLLARAITQRYTIPTNNRDSTGNGNVQKEIGKGNAQRILPTTANLGNAYNQMLLARKDEAGIIHSDEQNDFLLTHASNVEEFEELNATI
ncbi:hypothetical protein Tco_1159517 [Tanacetum coccineum]